MSECEERMNVATVDICPCGLVMHQLQADDYGTLGSDSGICCMDCGNEQFVTIEELQAELDKANEENKQLRSKLGTTQSLLDDARKEIEVLEIFCRKIVYLTESTRPNKDIITATVDIDKTMLLKAKDRGELLHIAFEHLRRQIQKYGSDILGNKS